MASATPKVLFATFDVVPGPTRHASIAQNLIQGLTRRFQVDAITLKARDLGHYEKTGRLRMFRVPVGSGDYLAQIDSFRRAVIRQLEGEEYQLVHVRSLLVGAPIAKRKGELGTKLLVDVSRFDSVEMPILHPQIAALRPTMERVLNEEDLCLAQADAIVTPSRITRELIQQRGRREKVHLIPDGVNVDLFDWQWAEPAAVPVIAYVGALAPWQGLVTLFEAMAMLLRKQKARLVIFHPGNDEQWQAPLKNLSKNLSLGSAIEFRGAVDHEDLPEILSQADVCVAPFARVGRNILQGAFPLKIVEYLACRRPTIASRLAIVEDLIADGVEGLLFTPGDADDLAQKILGLLADRALAARLSDAGYRKVRDLFTASRMRRRYMDVYRSLWEAAKEEFPPFGLDIPLETGEIAEAGETSTNTDLETPGGTRKPAGAPPAPPETEEEERDEQTAIFAVDMPPDSDEGIPAPTTLPSQDSQESVKAVTPPENENPWGAEDFSVFPPAGPAPKATLLPSKPNGSKGQ